MGTKIQHEKPSLTTPHLSMPPRLEIPPLSVRTAISAFMFGIRILGSCSIGWLVWFFFFFFKQFFRNFLEGRGDLCGFTLVSAFMFFQTLTGLHRGYFNITVWPPARCVRSPLEMDE